MSLITDALEAAISQIKPGMVATADKAGRPNVSPKGSIRVIDDKHIAFADLRSPQTVNNLKENPYVSIMGLDPTSRKGWRIWGKAEEIATSGALFEQLSKEYESKGKVNHAVVILVEKALVL